MKYLDHDSYSYKDMLKVEFKDIIEKFLPPREIFHSYSIGRACTQSIMLGFAYGYETVPDKPGFIRMKLCLGDYGLLVFEIDCETNYGTIVSEDSLTIIQNFLEGYSTESQLESSVK